MSKLYRKRCSNMDSFIPDIMVIEQAIHIGQLLQVWFSLGDLSL